MTSRSHDPHRQSQDLSIYGYLVGAAFLLLIIGSATVMNALITSSMNLQNLMLSAVVKAPVLFFDTNPVGRVLNRFSRDINIMEELLPEAFMMALQEVLYCLGAVILQSVLIPWIILPAIPLMVIFALIGRYYLNPSRDLRRLEAVNRSPVLSHFRDSLEGLVTIRAYKKENMSMEVCTGLCVFTSSLSTTHLLIFLRCQWMKHVTNYLINWLEVSYGSQVPISNRKIHLSYRPSGHSVVDFQATYRFIFCTDEQLATQSSSEHHFLKLRDLRVNTSANLLLAFHTLRQLLKSALP